MTGQRKGRVTPTDIELGRLVRAAAWSAAHRTATTGLQRDQVVLASIKNRFPRAVELFGGPAILALLRQPEGGTCAWDALRILSDNSPPTPTPGLHALLGAQCNRCKVWFAAQQVAEHERDHLAELQASGFRPSAAARIRPGRVEAAKAALTAAAGAPKPPRAPTGLLWATGDKESAEAGRALAASALRASGQRQRPRR